MEYSLNCIHYIHYFINRHFPANFRVHNQLNNVIVPAQKDLPQINEFLMIQEDSRDIQNYLCYDCRITHISETKHLNLYKILAWNCIPVCRIFDVILDLFPRHCLFLHSLTSFLRCVAALLFRSPQFDLLHPEHLRIDLNSVHDQNGSEEEMICQSAIR